MLLAVEKFGLTPSDVARLCPFFCDLARERVTLGLPDPIEAASSGFSFMMSALVRVQKRSLPTALCTPSRVRRVDDLALRVASGGSRVLEVRLPGSPTRGQQDVLRRCRRSTHRASLALRNLAS